MPQKWQHTSLQLVCDGVLTLPHPSTIDSWKDDMKIWPDLTLDTLIHYLMNSPAVDDRGQDAAQLLNHLEMYNLFAVSMFICVCCVTSHVVLCVLCYFT